MTFLIEKSDDMTKTAEIPTYVIQSNASRRFSLKCHVTQCHPEK